MELAQMKHRLFFVLLIASFVLFSLVFMLNSKVENMQRSNMRILQEIAVLRYIIDNHLENTINKSGNNSSLKKQSDIDEQGNKNSKENKTV